MINVWLSLIGRFIITVTAAAANTVRVSSDISRVGLYLSARKLPSILAHKESDDHSVIRYTAFYGQTLTSRRWPRLRLPYCSSTVSLMIHQSCDKQAVHWEGISSVLLATRMTAESNLLLDGQKDKSSHPKVMQLFLPTCTNVTRTCNAMNNEPKVQKSSWQPTRIKPRKTH